MFDSSKFYLGSLCKKEKRHEYEGTEYSLRYISTCHCLECQKEDNKKYREEHKDDEKIVNENIKEYQKQYQKKYQKERYKQDISYRLLITLRSRINSSLYGKNKSANSVELLGCSIVEWRKHLESTFKEGMCWNNYGEWEIDHIKPCSFFNLIIFEQQKECFNYKNTQALWKKENRIKNNKINWIR